MNLMQDVYRFGNIIVSSLSSLLRVSSAKKLYMKKKKNRDVSRYIYVYIYIYVCVCVCVCVSVVVVGVQHEANPSHIRPNVA